MWKWSQEYLVVKRVLKSPPATTEELRDRIQNELGIDILSKDDIVRLACALEGNGINCTVYTFHPW